MQIQRRALLAGVAAIVSVGPGCRRVPDKATGAAAASSSLADAHAHLFNGADLPAGRFLEFVVIPELWPGLPPFVGALLDLATTILKQFVVRAADESVGAFLAATAAGGDDLTPDRFGAAVQARITALEPATKSADPAKAALLEAYRDLTRVLADDAGRAFAMAPNKLAPAAPALAVDRQTLANEARVVFAAAAAKLDNPAAAAAVGPGDTVKAMGGAASAAKGQAARYVAWIWLMTKSRKHHLRKYVNELAAPDAKPKLIVNHLVDYDAWLGETPLDRSKIPDQITYWNKVSAQPDRPADIHTFAPFCPLKHAIEVATKKEAMLKALQKDYADGRIKGVKLYPPMGFRPANNVGIAQEMIDLGHKPRGLNWEFTSDPGALGLGNTAVKAWTDAAGKTAPLAPALDAAMAAFFTWAVKNDVPLMAHAGPGNQAAKDFGQRAHPQWWKAAADAYPGLRLSLGHLVRDPQAFVDAHQAVDPTLWADYVLEQKMLVPQGRIFGDLAYMPKLVDNPTLTLAFCKALMATFGKTDPNLEQILYGTDWIMFATEADNKAYPAQLRMALRNAGFADPELVVDNICWNNARRFLKLP